MANKKNNKRKFVAVGLGLIGIAGLSVASAATLNVTASDELAIGDATFAACATDAHVAYSYNDVSFELTNLDVSGIGTECNGKPIEVTLEYTPVNGAATTVTVDGSITATGTATLDVSSQSIAVADELGKATVIIG